jgi:hypothetical protein
MQISFVRPLPHERCGTLEWVPSLEFPNGKPECFAMASRSSSVCTLAGQSREFPSGMASSPRSGVHASRYRNRSVQRRAGKRRARLSIGAAPRRRRVLDVRLRGHDNRGSFSVIPAERAQRSESRNQVNAGRGCRVGAHREAGAHRMPACAGVTAGFSRKSLKGRLPMAIRTGG